MRTDKRPATSCKPLATRYWLAKAAAWLSVLVACAPPPTGHGRTAQVRPHAQIDATEWIDATATLDPRTTPVYEGDAPMKFELLKDMRKGDPLTLSVLSLGAHSGTHIDAPMHFIRDGVSVDRVSVQALIGPARVIDIPDRVQSIDAAELERHAWRGAERVFFRTRASVRGWMKSPQFHRDFAYIAPDAAQLLADAGVKVVGIDYISAEQFGAPAPRTHQILLGRGIPIVEGLLLEQIPSGDYDAIVLPIKVAGHEGAPARAVMRRRAAPRLLWQDEFDGPAGTSFDRAKWTADTGGHGFGNKERQFYTTLRQNVALDGAGHLVITARAEQQPSGYACWYGACRYTSARLKTQGIFTQTYGRVEARIRVPRGQGIWPAFWMLGADIEAVGWPASGEIDIMEHIGREPRVAYGTLHGPGYSGAQGISRGDTLPSGGYADDFHVFAVSWRPNEIRWFIDGRQYHRVTPESLPRGAKWVFDHPFFLLLNLAVGGEWPGDPDASTTFPQQLVVDYVRAYSDP